jgi:pilus assembly protein CpaC
MTKLSSYHRRTLGSAVAALAIGFGALAAPAPSVAEPTAGSYRPTRQVLLSVGEGELISLPRNVADVWTSNASVADVNVNNPRQIGLFGKSAGEATIIATAADGSVVYGANVRVDQNVTSMNQMLKAAMPDANISVTHVGQMAVLNGTVASPADAAQAEQIVRSLLNPGINTNDPSAVLRVIPVNRLKTATPLQVMLSVKIAEVSRSLVRDIGVNLDTIDPTGGSTGVVFARGRDSGQFTRDPVTGDPRYAFNRPIGTSSLGVRVNDVLGLGIGIAGALDLNENNGLVTVLAEPTLTALSGETASFLAGGEFPIPSSNGINGTAIEFKEYGVSLAFTPTVLEDGRISMRVRPEVSELSSQGAIQINGFSVPALTTRRTETTVELGSGQSFMIGGLLRNSGNNSVERTPGLGNLPIIGALFRSNSFRRNETELVIVVTPYLVKPVNANQIVLPTDGFRSATTGERVVLDKEQGRSGNADRPRPTVAEPQSAPAMGSMSALPAPAKAPAPAPQRAQAKAQPPAARPQQPSATPGFSF